MKQQRIHQNRRLTMNNADFQVQESSKGRGASRTRFTLIELLVNAACKTGVLYNRCGMLSLWGGALKTDKNGYRCAAEYGWFRPTTKYPAFFERKGEREGKRKLFFP